MTEAIASVVPALGLSAPPKDFQRALPFFQNENGLALYSQGLNSRHANLCSYFVIIISRLLFLVFSSKQRELYDETFRSLVESVLNGFNGTIFAYGQTGTGKTYTMEGTLINTHS